MADELTNALAGLQFTPAENEYGLVTQGLASALPSLINPYGSVGTNLGITLGGTLLTSLLGYQARKEASANTLNLMTYANQLQAMPDVQQRTDFIKSIDDASYQGRLATLATALNAKELESQMKLKEAVGLETGKMKAMQEFYASPAGQAQREFEIKKIEEEAKARRTPFDEWAAKQAIEQANKEKLTKMGIEGKKELQTIKDDRYDARAELDRKAKSGDKEADREFKRQMSTQQQEFDKAMVQYKADVGVNAAREKAQTLATLEMQLINEGNSPEMAKLEAKAQLTRQLNQDLVQAKEESTKRLQDYQTKQVKDRETYRRQLELEHPKVPAAIVSQSAKRVTIADNAMQIADDIEKFANWTTYRVGTAFSATDEALLRSRIMKLTAEERLALSGTATNKDERIAIDQMLNGDLTAGPETKAALLRRFAADSKRMAVSNIKGASQNVGSFVKAVEDSLANNTPTQFSVPGGTPGVTMEDLQARLLQLQEKRRQLEAQKAGGVR
jgi:hypothetical protein